MEDAIAVDAKPSIARVVTDGKLIETSTEVKEVTFSAEEIEQGIEKNQKLLDAIGQDVAKVQSILDMWMERKAALAA